jgi:hypothetical protein
MAKLIINDREVTVSLSAVEKLEALHGNVVVPRSARWHRFVPCPTAWSRSTGYARLAPASPV